MAYYTIEPERATLHGSFSREFPPVLTIDSGDTVRFRTLDVGWGLEPHPAPTPNPSRLEAGATSESRRDAGATRPSARRTFEPRIEGRDSGHALCGPVAIRGAEPGMTLEVQIDAIRPGAWGTTYFGGGRRALYQRLGLAERPDMLTWTLDPDALVGRDQAGRAVALRPFMGILGMPPDAPGIHSTNPPRPCGGNIDCKELVAGSRLYLPIAVPGALFSTGDGHAVQGDGEVCGTAIECPMERVDLTFRLHPDLHLTTPRAQTPAGWITFGFHEDLNEATMIALAAILDLLAEQYDLERPLALALASLVVDLHITQIVNGVRGAHAILPPDAIRR